jgi:hypothetical protein
MHFIDRSHAAFTLMLRHTMSLQAVLCGPDIVATLDFFKICSDGREQPARPDGPASSGNLFMLTMRSNRLQARCIYRERVLMPATASLSVHASADASARISAMISARHKIHLRKISALKHQCMCRSNARTHCRQRQIARELEFQ